MNYRNYFIVSAVLAGSLFSDGCASFSEENYRESRHVMSNKISDMDYAVERANRGLEKMVYSVEKPKKTHCLWGF
jgi:hypothetical protein